MRDPVEDGLEPICTAAFVLALCVGSAWAMLSGLGWLGLTLVQALGFPASVLGFSSADPGLVQAGLAVVAFTLVGGGVLAAVWSVLMSFYGTGLRMFETYRTRSLEFTRPH